MANATKRMKEKKRIQNKDHNKIWFIHMPKTGGIFLRHYFEKCNNIEKQVIIGMSKPRNHDGIVRIKNSDYKFGFVRNPWDHRVSMYYYWQKRSEKTWVTSNQSFERFIKDISNNVWSKKNLYKNNYHQMPRYNNMFCINGKLAIDYVGKFETLHEDVKKIFKINNIEMTISIDDYYKDNKDNWDISNYSHHDHYSTYYTTELIDIVYEQEKKIIEIYDYKFEKFP